MSETSGNMNRCDSSWDASGEYVAWGMILNMGRANTGHSGKLLRKKHWFGLAVLALIVSLVLDGVFTVKESPPIFSGDERTQRELMVELLAQLRSREHESYCTFERVQVPNVWFQVYGRSLSTGNFPCPLAGDPIDDLSRLKIALPDGIEVMEDKTYQNQRVITFECESISPVAWADFIDAIFRQVHFVPNDYRLKGWLTKED